MAAVACFFCAFFTLIPHSLAGSAGSSCSVDKAKFSWFLNDDLYYMLYDDDTLWKDSHCVCDSLTKARLAIFDYNVTFDDTIRQFLLEYHPSSGFWLDASRENTTHGEFMWGSQCPLATDDPLWHKPEEPGSGEGLVRADERHGIFEYWGITDDASFRPFCQSATRPFNYLPTPPTLTWTRLGEAGHQFGFSDVTLSLNDARAACKQQAGSVYLATLDLLFTEVATYVMDNHPDRIFWLDANVETSAALPDVLEGLQWATGGNVSSTDFASGTSGLYSSLVLFKQNNGMKLTQSAGTSLYYFICEGDPATESTSVPNPENLEWHELGSPYIEFGFSTNQKSLADARQACKGQTGKVRLAVLDTHFTEVKDWVRDNHVHREYWVDATRPASSDVDFRWSTGQTVNESVMRQTHSSDVCARLNERSSDIWLDGTGTCGGQKYYVCERELDVNLEWRLLGTPETLFGFSRTSHWTFEGAREACERHLGDVKLATLDTHFDDVRNFISSKYSNSLFWVDGATPNGSKTTAKWANGVPVDDSFWFGDEPHQIDTLLVVFSMGLAAISESIVETASFICQGKPASPIADREFAPSCTPEMTTEGTASTAVTSATTESTDAAEETATACNNAVRVFNISDEELARIVQEIRDNLTVDTSNLSATIRKVISAKDDRSSAQAAGVLGIVMLVIPALLVILPDVIAIVQFTLKKVRRLRKKLGKRKAKRSNSVESGLKTDVSDGNGDCTDGAQNVEEVEDIEDIEDVDEANNDESNVNEKRVNEASDNVDVKEKHDDSVDDANMMEKNDDVNDASNTESDANADGTSKEVNVSDV